MMIKTITNNITLNNFDCFEIIENIKEVHEYILKCCSSEYNDLYYVPTVNILNGGFIVE